MKQAGHPARTSFQCPTPPGLTFFCANGKFCIPRRTFSGPGGSAKPGKPKH